MRLSPPGLLLLSAAVLIALPASAVDLPEIQARGSLRVIAAEGEQPEMFDFDGDPAKPGLEREMLEGFARLKRLKLEVVPVKAFTDRIPALLRGDGDVIVGLVDTAERRSRSTSRPRCFPCATSWSPTSPRRRSRAWRSSARRR